MLLEEALLSVEQNSVGCDLKEAYAQAGEYFDTSPERDCPRQIRVSANSCQLLGSPIGHRRNRQCPDAVLSFNDAILFERLSCFFAVGNGLV